MKLLLVYWPLLTALLFITPATAQDSKGYKLFDTEYGDSVSHYIKKLTENKVDTIIRFDLPPHHDYSDTIKRHHRITYPNISYIFYRSDNKTFTVEYTWFRKIGNETDQYMSDPRELAGDTLFDWFAANIAEGFHYNNDIYPFIYEVKEAGFTRYLPWKPLYAETYTIGLYAAGERSRKYIDTDDLELRNRHNKINLNYGHNKDAKLCRLFLMLELLSQQSFPKMDYE